MKIGYAIVDLHFNRKRITKTDLQEPIMQGEARRIQFASFKFPSFRFALGYYVVELQLL